MLIQINGEPTDTETMWHAVSYLDVADELLSADGYYFKNGVGVFGYADTSSPALPEDFSGFNLDAFLDRVRTLATQV